MAGIEFDGVNNKIELNTGAAAADQHILFNGNAKDFYVALDDSADKLVVGEGSTVGTNSILTITDDSVTIGDAAAVDTKIVFDGNAQDFYVGLDDSEDDLIIGRGSTVGTSADIRLNADGDVGLSVAPDNVGSGRTLHIKGHNTDGANIRLESTGDTAGTDDMTITKNNTECIINLIGADSFKIKTSNTERFDIDPDGVVSITTSGNGDNLSLISTDADANAGPNLRLYRNSSSPADGDQLAKIDFEGRNDNSQDVSYFDIIGYTRDVSDGEEDGILLINGIKAGSAVEYIRLDPHSSHNGIVFNDGGTDMDFRVESSGNANMLTVNGGSDLVGIGADPDLGAGLHIKTSDSGASVAANYDELVLENSAHCGMTILSGTSSAGGYRFGDSGDNDIGGVIYDHSDNSLTLKNNAANSLVIDSTGAVTMPLQPAFHVHPASEQADFGSGQVIAVVWGTDRFDLNGDFASNSFTAPVTGKYHFDVNIGIDEVNTDNSTNYYYIQLTTSNRVYYHLQDIARAGALDWYLSFSVLADMDASDTANVQIVKGGSNTSDTSDIIVESWFSGFLVC